jgi:hypothetical protein
MRQFDQISVEFHPLYAAFRKACPDAQTEPTLGRFLLVLDAQVLELLLARMQAFFDGALPEPLIDDIVHLTKAIAADEDFPIIDAEDVIDAAQRVYTGVAGARLVQRGLLSADLRPLALAQGVMATRTDQAVLALGGATHLPGAVLH